MSLTVEQILGAEDKATRRVQCPEWGGDVYIRTISADERDRFELSISENRVGTRAALVGLAMCDEAGRALNPTVAQIKALGTKASGPIDRIFDAVLELNKMRKEDMEKLEGNSEATAEPDCG